MAAFINRGGGRANLASASGVVVNSTLFQPVASLQMSAGATANGGGFVVVWAAWQGDPATPAPLTTQPRDTSGGGADSTDIVETASEAERVSGAVTWVFSIPADATRTYALEATTAGVDAGFNAQMSAIYVPFGHTGGNTL